MSRVASLAVLLGTCVALGGCHESAKAQGAPTQPDAAVAPGSASAPTDEPDEPATRAIRIGVSATQITVDGAAVAKPRPANAPGALEATFEATYAYRELADRIPPDDPRPRTIVAGADVSLGLVRGVLASTVKPGGAFELTIGDANTSMHAPDDEPAHAYLRPRRGGWQLRLDEKLVAEAKTVAELAPALGNLDAKTASSGIALDLPDDAPVGELAAVATAVAAAAGGARLIVARDYAPCLEPPPDMVCIPGGPAIVGYDDGLPEEAPAREIRLSTYYVDKHEVTNAQFDTCHFAGACRIRINRHQKIMKPFVGADQPAMPMDWHRARHYCAWAGKRLPTEWEWEKAARGPDGELFPWGDDEPTCDKSVYRECAPFGCTPYPGKTNRWDCNEHATKRVGSFPAGHYGLFDMAGNGYEWTATAGIDSVADCGDACQGRDPTGPCDGAYPCQGERILKGGSWYWPKHRTRGSHRRLEKLSTGSHRLSMRCATSNPYLTVYPPRHATVERGAPALEPPTEERKATFAGIREDPIEDKPICDSKTRATWGSLQAQGGRSTPSCRDPFPYVMSNEPRGHVWAPYIENLGGAYIGIGSDQNYSYIAQARSEWAWVVDYDPRVYHNHLRLRAFILAAQTPKAFIALFTPEEENKAMKILTETYADDPDVDAGRLRFGYKATREKLLPYFEAKAKRRRKGGNFGWLRNADHYRHIRTLLQQGRMRPVRGDLLAKGGAMASMAEAARSLGVPVRIYYTSNAPSSWGGDVTDAYRENVLALPFDALSVVLQTNSRGGFAQKGKWHHNVTWGPFHHERLRIAGYDTIPKLLEGRIPGDDGDVTLLGLPSDATAPLAEDPQRATESGG